MHVYLMIFAVFALIFRCWMFCLSFDLIKVLVFACFVLYLLVSACLLYFFPLYLHMEEGTTKRGGDKGASPHGAEHRPPWLRITNRNYILRTPLVQPYITAFLP